MLKFAIAGLPSVALILSGPAWQKPQTPRSDPEFYIKVEVQGPLVPSSDLTKPNIAYIQYGEGFERQTVLLKWSDDNKQLADCIKRLHRKWVVVTGRLEIGIPPEVRVESIRESSARP